MLKGPSKNQSDKEEAQDWNGFLSKNENKEQVITLIADKWKHDVHTNDDCPIIFIENGQATHISFDGTECMPHLDSTQEETDTCVILYIQYAQDNGHKFVRVGTKDSDIFFLLLHYGKKFSMNIIFDNGNHLISVTNIAEENTQEWCTAMMTLHCFTGCDSTSAFKGKEKVKPFNALQNATKFLSVLSQLGLECDVS